MKRTITTATGEQITCETSSAMNMKILMIQANFSPFVFRGFADNIVNAIDQVRAVTGMQATGRNCGYFKFLLRAKTNEAELLQDVEHEFKTFFIQF